MEELNRLRAGGTPTNRDMAVLSIANAIRQARRGDRVFDDWEDLPCPPDDLSMAEDVMQSVEGFQNATEQGEPS